MSIDTKGRPWFCSEACLHLGVTKEQAAVSESCPVPPHPWPSLHSVLLVNGHIPELAILHPQLFQPPGAAYKCPKESDKPGKLPGWQFSKCFALFLQREHKATVRYRLYDFQGALTMNRAEFKVSVQVRLCHTCHLSMQSLLISPALFHPQFKVWNLTSTQQLLDHGLAREVRTNLCLSCRVSLEQWRSQTTLQSSAPRGKLLSVERICLGDKFLEISLIQGLMTFRS